MTTMDYNVDNYTISELLAILGEDDPTEEEITDTTNSYIEQSDMKGDFQMSSFFQDMQTKLLQYTNQLATTGEDDEYQPNEEQTEEWYEEQVLPQKDNPTQSDKTTERKQKIDVYDNQHVPMNREQLGVNNNFNVPVAQDTLNPNLENIISRFINLDSQFRQGSSGLDNIATDYTLDLSDPLTDVLSLRLYSIQIPYTWYAIEPKYGNTCFWIVIPDVMTGQKHYVQVTFPPGNYSQDTFVTQFNQSLTTSGITSATSTTAIVIGVNDAKVTINLNGYIYTEPVTGDTYTITGILQGSLFDENTNPYFLFFDFSGNINCGLGCNPQNLTFNWTLGWLMGFRLPITPIYVSPGNKADAIIDLYGPKYFILVLDDYNQNHINNGLISITELSNKLAIPAYYNTSQPYVCVPNTQSAILNANAIGNLGGQSAQQNIANGIDVINLANSLQEKLDYGYRERQVILPSAPRTLTKAQIHTINEIIKNREKTTTYRAKAPTTTDTFAIIPIKKGGMSTGDLYVEFGGSVQDNKRVYFGPVDIDRMRIRLLDDRGNAVDLHGVDWCITIIAEILYQY